MPSTTDLLTRCPQCHTTFRATAEQLAVRNGRVRCGQCQHAFDAVEASLDVPAELLPPAPEPVQPPPTAALAQPAEAADALSLLPPTTTTAEADKVDDAADIEDFPDDTVHLLDPHEPTLGDRQEITEDNADITPSDIDVLLTPPSTQETAESRPPTDIGPSDDEHDSTPPAPVSHRTGWLFLLASLILIVLLLGQAGYRFRTELSTALPGLKDIYIALGTDVPLPQHAEQISIEGSDLQADAVHNLLILNASIKNRAPWSQTYPLLELTLTDARDAVLLRRSFKPADYLPPDSPPVFGPHADLAVRLWLDTHGTPAAGYRLYVYYLPDTPR